MAGSVYIHVAPFQIDAENVLEDLKKHIQSPTAMDLTVFDMPTGLRSPYEHLVDRLGKMAILEIEGVSSKPRFLAASPISDVDLKALFGTVRPTPAMITDLPDSFYEQIDRGQARYFAIYADEKPKSIVFIGFSAD